MPIIYIYIYIYIHTRWFDRIPHHEVWRWHGIYHAWQLPLSGSCLPVVNQLPPSCPPVVPQSLPNCPPESTVSGGPGEALGLWRCPFPGP